MFNDNCAQMSFHVSSRVETRLPKRTLVGSVNFICVWILLSAANMLPAIGAQPYDGAGPFRLMHRNDRQGLDTLLSRGRVRPSELLTSDASTGTSLGQRTIFRDVVTGAEVWRLTNLPQGVVRHVYSIWPAWNANGRILQVQFSPSGGRAFVDGESGAISDGDKVRGGVWSPTEPDIVYTTASWNATIAVVAYDIAQGKVLRGIGPGGSGPGLEVSDDGKWLCWAFGGQDQAMIWAVARSDGSLCRMCSAAGGILSQKSPATFDPPPLQPPITDLDPRAIAGGMHSIHFTRAPDHSVSMDFNLRLKNGDWRVEQRVYSLEGKLMYVQKTRTGHTVRSPDGSFMFGETSHGYGKYDPIADRFFDPLNVADVYEGHISWTGYDPRWVAVSWHTRYGAEVTRVSMRPDNSIVRLCGVCPQTPQAGAYNNLAFACQSPDATKILFMSSMSGSVNEYVVVAANPRAPKLAGRWTREGFQLTIVPDPLSREIRRFKVYRAESNGGSYTEIGRIERSPHEPVFPIKPLVYLVKDASRAGEATFSVRAEEWSGLSSRYSDAVSTDGKPLPFCIEAEAQAFQGFKEGFDPRAAGDMDYLLVPSTSEECSLAMYNGLTDAQVWARVSGDGSLTAVSRDQMRSIARREYASWTWVNLGKLSGKITIKSHSPGFKIDRFYVAPAGQRPEGIGPDYAVAPAFSKLVPTGVHAKCLSPFAAKITWEFVPGARYYNVYASDHSDFTPAQSNLLYSPPAGAELAIDWGIKPAVRCYYKVVAVDADGSLSKPSSAVAIIAPRLPTETLQLQAENGEGATVVSDPSAADGKSATLESGKTLRFKFTTKTEGNFVIWNSFRCDHARALRLHVTIDNVRFDTRDMTYDYAMLFGRVIA